MQSMENKPAGWYRNSDDRRQHGYWDGFAWDETPADGTTSSAADLDHPDELEAPATQQD